MQNKQKNRWWLNAALFAGLILACFVNLTGLALHQWIGIIAGAAALYHLIDHMEWVEAARQRFFGRIAPRARAYFLIDAALLVGFFIMVGTGLVMSTWLNLSLANYAAWRSLHLTATITTLVITALKVVLHRNWILQVARKWVFSPKTGVTAIAPTSLARRDFLGMMGVVGAATVLALAQTVQGLQNTAVEGETLASTGSILPTPGTTTTTISTATAAAAASNEITAAATATGTSSTTTAAAATISSDTTAAATTTTTSNTTAAACTVRCGKGCSFPGRCRRYTDTNGNSRCDLGKCL
jgi:hypothetical protein